MGRHQEALASAHRAVELDPLSPVNITDEGRILYRARQYERAIALYKQALELDPGYHPALSRIADAYEQLGKFDEVLASVQKLTQYATDSRVGLRPQARIYARMARRREPIQIVQTIAPARALPATKF